MATMKNQTLPCHQGLLLLLFTCLVSFLELIPESMYSLTCVASEVSACLVVS